MKNKLILGGLMFLTPAFAFAQGDADLTFFTNLVTSIGEIVELLVPILIGIALVVFFWGLIKFIVSAGDEEGRAKGKQIMIWGIIALVIMVSIWGIIVFVQEIFGIEDANINFPDAPDF